MKGYVPQLVAMGVVVGALLGTYQPAFPGHHGSHVVVAPGGQAPRVGPSNLYPDPELTPGATNPNVTQGNIQQTICKSAWTGTIRPPTSFTNDLRLSSFRRHATKTRCLHTTRKTTSSLSKSGVIPMTPRTSGRRCGEPGTSTHPHRPVPTRDCRRQVQGLGGDTSEG